MMPSDSAWHLWFQLGGRWRSCYPTSKSSNCSTNFPGVFGPPEASNLIPLEILTGKTGRLKPNPKRDYFPLGVPIVKPRLKHLASGNHWTWMNMAFFLYPPKKAIYIGIPWWLASGYNGIHHFQTKPNDKKEKGQQTKTFLKLKQLYRYDDLLFWCLFSFVFHQSMDISG